jgi:RNA-binding protein
VAPESDPVAPAATPLRGFQKRWLRARAHGLRAVVQVGDEGVTDGLVAALDRALLDHELVKVRMLRPADKKESARALARATTAELCGLVGHTAILYRRNSERARIELPERE